MSTAVLSRNDELSQQVHHWLTGGSAARDLHDDPHALFDRLRAEDPAHRLDNGAYVLTRYADIKHFLSQPSPSREAALPPPERRGYFLQMMSDFLLQNDPPRHARLRRLVQRAFLPRALAVWAPRIEAVVADMLQSLAPAGHMDLMRDFAEPIPMTVICELLGLPNDFSTLMTDLGAVTIGNNDPTPKTPEFFAEADRVAHRYADWLVGIIKDRERNPGSDLLTTILDVECDNRLTHDEVAALVANIHFGGWETTAGLIGVAMVLLMRHPDQFAALRADPSLIDSTIEEVLRHSPTGTVLKPRVTTQPMTYSGVTIPAGAPVYALTQFGNRDPEMFARPHEFDIRRKPNEHMGFGTGIHFCLGLNLARLEAKCAVQQLIAALPDIRLEGAEPVWRDSLITRSYETIPVAWNAG